MFDKSLMQVLGILNFWTEYKFLDQFLDFTQISGFRTLTLFPIF